MSSHQRQADPDMIATISALGFDEIDRVMNYISRIRVPQSDLDEKEVGQ